jgi:hypothetical protein
MVTDKEESFQIFNNQLLSVRISSIIFISVKKYLLIHIVVAISTKQKYQKKGSKVQTF